MSETVAGMAPVPVPTVPQDAPEFSAAAVELRAIKTFCPSMAASCRL